MSTSGTPGTAPPPMSRLGEHIKLAFDVYMAAWKDWIAPSAIVFGIGFASALCCYLPFFLAYGPLAVGMYTCAFHALRKMKVDTTCLSRGQDILGRSMGAGLMLMLIQLGPLLLLIGLLILAQFVVMGLFMAAAGAEQAGGGGGGEAAAGAAGVMFLVTMGLYLVGLLAFMVWSLWIGTRLMFVMPLIADRGLDYRTAMRESWQATRTGFWELLVMHLLAGLIGGLGANLLYVGLIFTMPLYFLMIAATYEERFPPPPSGSPFPPSANTPQEGPA